jgi:hypothetical protein
MLCFVTLSSELTDAKKYFSSFKSDDNGPLSPYARIRVYTKPLARNNPRIQSKRVCAVCAHYRLSTADQPQKCIRESNIKASSSKIFPNSMRKTKSPSCESVSANSAFSVSIPRSLPPPAQPTKGRPLCFLKTSVCCDFYLIWI